MSKIGPITADLVGAFSDILTVLRNASEADQAVAYGRPGLRLVYLPEHRTVRAAPWLSTDSQWQFRVSGVGLGPIAYSAGLSAEFVVGGLSWRDRVTAIH